MKPRQALRELVGEEATEALLEKYGRFNTLLQLPDDALRSFLTERQIQVFNAAKHLTFEPNETQLLRSAMLYHEIRDLAYEPCEVGGILYMDSKLRLCGRRDLWRGTRKTFNPDIIQAVQRGLMLNSTRWVFYHNHPSGSYGPSKSDLLMTRQWRAQLIPMGLQMIDHIIVHHEGYFSFNDNGWPVNPNY